MEKHSKNTTLISGLLLLLTCICQQAQAQFSTTASNNGPALVNALVGTGSTISNVQISCPGTSSGTFKNGNSSNLGLNEGILLTTGSVNLVARAASNFNDTNNNAGGDADINAIVSPLISYDGCRLEFDFEPVGSSMSFQYVFASEEYPEYACTDFNDVFAFLINGPGYSNDNIALIPNTAIPVAINTVNNVPPNCVNNPGYYVNNQSGSSVVYDGFTTVLTASAEVIPCETYHLKLVIADVNDRRYDSGVFLKKGSFNVGVYCANQTITLNDNGTASITAQSLYSDDNPDCISPISYSASQTTFDCDDLGNNTVTLTVTFQGNQSASCQANVEVLDGDTDGDGIGNCSDDCPLDPDNDADGDGICANEDNCPLDPDNDADGDGVCGDVDNCPSVANADQLDTDGDGDGNACDQDDDNDGCLDADDANPLVSSNDSDGDGLADDCDACPLDPNNDADGDGVCGNLDNCPDFANTDQLDTDGDGNGDACDADDDNDGCMDEDDANPVSYSADSDGDGQHDDCDPCPFDALNDADGDGVCANEDNCPTVANTDQLDTDSDGSGNACDADDDNDGCLDADDEHPLESSGDSDCDGVADDCDHCPGGDDSGPCDATSLPPLENLPPSWICSNNGNSRKVYVCHNGNTLCVSQNAVNAHLAHGDFLGPCSSCGERDNTVGSDDHELLVELVPNPAISQVLIDLQGLEHSGGRLELVDMLGKVLITRNIDAGMQRVQVTLSLQGIASGKYLVKVMTDSEVQSKTLLIVK